MMTDNLNQVIDEWRNKKFVWGVSDCCQFAIACEKSIKGKIKNQEMIESLSYSSKETATKEFNKLGYNNFLHYIDSAYKRINKNLVKRGDYGLIRTDNNFSITVNLGNYFAGMSEEGLVFFRNHELIRKAWAI